MIARVDLDVDKNTLRIRLETEDLAEIPVLMNAVTRTKRPAQAFGGLSQKGAWAWFHFPIKAGNNGYVPFSGGKE